MSFHNPFRRARPKARREEPRRTGDRVILRGAAKTEKRREVFERSNGYCEADRMIQGRLQRCYREITWGNFHFSHEQHGPRRDDRRAIASCEECHLIGVHNPKSCNRRPGKVMKIKDAKEYWSGKICFCDGEKKAAESFCSTCRGKLSNQTVYDLEHCDNPEDYRQALAAAEIEILTWKAAE